MASKRNTIRLLIIIASVIVLVLLILLFIHLCSSQGESPVTQSESDKQEEITTEKEPVKEEKIEKAEKTEEQQPVEKKEETPAAKEQEKASEEKVIMFNVSARKKWQYPGIEISPEMKIIISYEKGEWAMGQGWPYTDAEGSPHVDVNRMFRAIAPGALVGRVGNNKEFKIGNSCEISGSHMTGKLALIINDATGYYNDNLGSITIKIIVQQ